MMSVHFNYFKRMEMHAWSVGGTLVPEYRCWKGQGTFTHTFSEFPGVR